MKAAPFLMALVVALTALAMAQEARVFNLKQIQEFKADDAVVKTIIDRPALRVRPTSWGQARAGPVTAMNQTR